MMNLDKIAMGFKWTPDMSFKEFVENNKTCDYEKAFEFYKKIEERYLFEKYEKG